MASATDDFNRANGGLGANWTTITSEAAPQIRSNLVEVNASATDAGAWYNAVTFGANQWASIKVVAATTDTQRAVAVTLRTASGARTYYYVEVAGPLGASATVGIAKFVAGAHTGLTSTTASVSSGATLRARVTGTGSATLITAWINGVQVLSHSGDTSISSGQPGVRVYIDPGSQPTSQAQLDDWAAGELSPPPYHRSQRFMRQASGLLVPISELVLGGGLLPCFAKRRAG